MPRRSRIHIDGMPLHIVQRGHKREPCFFAEQDYLAYLHWLAKAMKEADVRLHAYALMTNPVYLLITPPRGRGRLPSSSSRWAGATCSTSTRATGAVERCGTAATSLVKSR